jgi:phosphoribosylaminoimidazolecarboxamide formyltransferase/IMP cyclohydrolase
LQRKDDDSVGIAACDPTSAFGGVLIANTKIDVATAIEINKLFCRSSYCSRYDANS